MDKIAQKRNPWHKIREKVSPFGQAAEAFSPTFAKLMNELRNTDEMIRDSLLNQDPKIKDLLKSAKSNFNRREYMPAVVDLKRFHDRIDPVIRVLENLKLEVDAAHHEFIFGDLSGETLEGLKELSDKFKNFQTKARSNSELVKEAFLGDLWHLLTNDKAKALKGWEKRYPAKMRQLKSDANSLIRQSEHVFGILLQSLKEMSAARAARNIDRYMKAAEKLISRYKTYNVDFHKFYKTHVEGFLNKQKVVQDPNTTVTDDTGLGDKEVVNEAPSTLPSAQVSRDMSPAPGSSVRAPSQPTGKSPGSTLPSPAMSVKERKTVPVEMIPPPGKLPADLMKQVQPGVDSEAVTVRGPNASPLGKLPPINPPTKRAPFSSDPKTEEDLEPPTMVSQQSNKLINTLKVLSSEDPKVLALEIYKHAKDIEKTNPVTSSKLMKIVGKIVNGK